MIREGSKRYDVDLSTLAPDQILRVLDVLEANRRIFVANTYREPLGLSIYARDEADLAAELEKLGIPRESAHEWVAP